jgi:glyoxylase-like metal-dependent hydrolase (beta-lactamase superfamily II)
VGPINCYFAQGDELTLVDTGPRDPTTLVALREALNARGFKLHDIRRIVVTHAHVDHFGLASQIVAESGADVLSHSLNRWWLTDLNREWERRYEFYHDVFARSGAPIDLAEKAVAGMRRMSEYAASIPLDHFVPMEDGDTVNLGRDVWRVVYAPGHASGLICLFEPTSRTLISSDHLLRDITSNPVMEPPARGDTRRPRALVDYIASMERTARLDVRIALPAHGEPIYDVPALVDGRIAFHRSRLAHIESQLECCAQTPFEICNILFPNLKSFDVFLGLSEVIGHLDVLEAEGRVRLESSDGVWRYIPTRKT